MKKLHQALEQGKKAAPDKEGFRKDPPKKKDPDQKEGDRNDDEEKDADRRDKDGKELSELNKEFDDYVRLSFLDAIEALLPQDEVLERGR